MTATNPERLNAVFIQHPFLAHRNFETIMWCNQHVSSRRQIIDKDKTKFCSVDTLWLFAAVSFGFFLPVPNRIVKSSMNGPTQILMYP
jgi:hypothetical protein